MMSYLRGITKFFVFTILTITFVFNANAIADETNIFQIEWGNKETPFFFAGIYEIDERGYCKTVLIGEDGNYISGKNVTGFPPWFGIEDFGADPEIVNDPKWDHPGVIFKLDPTDKDRLKLVSMDDKWRQQLESFKIMYPDFPDEIFQTAKIVRRPTKAQIENDFKQLVSMLNTTWTLVETIPSDLPKEIDGETLAINRKLIGGFKEIAVSEGNSTKMVKYFVLNNEYGDQATYEFSPVASLGTIIGTAFFLKSAFQTIDEDGAVGSALVHTASFFSLDDDGLTVTYLDNKIGFITFRYEAEKE